MFPVEVETLVITQTSLYFQRRCKKTIAMDFLISVSSVLEFNAEN